MPADQTLKDARLEALRALLGREVVRSQETLVASLRRLGHVVTQASVSRDLRELGAHKVAGRYQIEVVDDEPGSAPALALVRSLLRSMRPAGPHLVVCHTATGGAQPVGIAVDEAGWPEVVGTVAGDDTLFIATSGAQAQRRLLRRLVHLVDRGETHG